MLFLAVDFMNFTYKTNPCYANVPVPAVMRRGKFWYTDKDAADFMLTVDSVKQGSLKAGAQHAVVVIECDYPVGGTAAAYLFEQQGSTAMLLGKVATADWGGDWGAGPTSIRVRFSNRKLYVEQCADSECTAKQHLVYALRNGKLVKI